MRLPFTTDEFFRVFANYNLKVWPMQFVLLLMAIAIILLALKRRSYSSKYVVLILSFLWIWMGAVYHLAFFSTINKAAYIFGGIFILQGILFLLAARSIHRISFQFKKNIYGFTGMLFIVYSLAIYPSIGLFLGHDYPASPTFGLPCPTTIFTFGILLWMNKRVPIYLLIIPLLWTAIGFLAAFSMGVYEDIGLLVAGIVTAVLNTTKGK